MFELVFPHYWEKKIKKAVKKAKKKKRDLRLGFSNEMRMLMYCLWKNKTMSFFRLVSIHS